MALIALPEYDAPVRFLSAEGNTFGPYAGGEHKTAYDFLGDIIVGPPTWDDMYSGEYLTGTFEDMITEHHPAGKISWLLVNVDGQHYSVSPEAVTN